MSRPRSVSLARAALLALAAAASLAAAGCGGEVTVPDDSRTAATLFNERCSGCHSLKSANAYGSKPTGQLEGGERTNGPNFNVRKVARDDVLYAIRNGGFSGAIMPANIVTGEDAETLAAFLDEYSGAERSSQAGGP